MAETEIQTPASVLTDRRTCRLVWFGEGEYGRMLALQEELRAARRADAVPDTWLMGEHPFVITQGVRGKPEDLRAVSGGKVPVFQIDRGGMTTLHSPGQLIVYPVVKVGGGSLAAGRLARALVRTLQSWLREEFGVEAEHRPRQPGLYVEGRKLMSIGISVRQGVSMHGIAMNLCNDLSLWSAIVACGDASSRPISLSQILGREVCPSDQVKALGRWLHREWGYENVVYERRC